MRRIVALSVVLWVVPWAEADDSMHQMLPLAVGNSWEYQLEITPNEEPLVPFFFAELDNDGGGGGGRVVGVGERKDTRNARYPCRAQG